jgi:hypothetical protein
VCPPPSHNRAITEAQTKHSKYFVSLFGSSLVLAAVNNTGQKKKKRRASFLNKFIPVAIKEEASLFAAD